MKDLTATDAAWIAGIVDTRGSLSMSTRGRPRLTVTTRTRPDLLREMAHLIGEGNVKVDQRRRTTSLISEQEGRHYGPYIGKSGGSTQFEITGESLHALMEQLEPYLLCWIDWETLPLKTQAARERGIERDDDGRFVSYNPADVIRKRVFERR